MITVLLYVVVLALIAGALFFLASAVFGRGEELAPLPAAGTLATLPSGDICGEDVQALRFQQALRGYKSSEVDWALDRLAAEIDCLRAQIAEQDSPREQRG